MQDLNVIWILIYRETHTNTYVQDNVLKVNILHLQTSERCFYSYVRKNSLGYQLYNQQFAKLATQALD